MNQLARNYGTRDSIPAYKQAAKRDATLTKSPSGVFWSKKSNDKAFVVVGNCVRSGQKIGSAEDRQIKQEVFVTASKVKVSLNNCLLSMDTSPTFTNSLVSSGWTVTPHDPITGTEIWGGAMQISAQLRERISNWVELSRILTTSVSGPQFQSLQHSLIEDLNSSFAQAEEHGFPVMAAGKKEAEWFISLIPTALALKPELAVGSDGEVNFLWQGTKGWLDVGFYGEGKFSAVMKTISPRKTESLSGRETLTTELPEEFSGWFAKLV